MPRRSAVAELPPHLVRITSVHAKREWSFMKIKLFSCQTPHVRACARARCPGHSGNSCATGCAVQLSATASTFTFSKDILRGGQGGIEYSIENTAYILRK